MFQLCVNVPNENEVLSHLLTWNIYNIGVKHFYLIE